ncbi:MAG: alpha/beta hydrolase [Tannerella sp.]|jgi:pimeloyl-ACP methyl ester carboxylesterase|nr:alpha/beta hydrolase [Tannerella sp.]
MKKVAKAWYKRIWLWLTILVISYSAVQGIRCAIAVGQSEKRLDDYGARTVALSYGKMSYVDRGRGDAILSVHGIFGGYDQAYDTCEEFGADHRIIAPSRFGYLGSDIYGSGSPAEQAAAYVELLDHLGIEKVFILGASAGGTPAIRFALDYPERTNGLILFCSAMPYIEKPDKYPEYAGPPAFLCNDYAMFLISPLFKPVMGMESSTIYAMLPVGRRKDGVALDASVTNPDMARNFDSYPIESLQVPTLILHAKDDKLADYAQTEKAVSRFPNCTFVSFETGGHLMVGHSDEIEKAVRNFIKNAKNTFSNVKLS